MPVTIAMNRYHGTSVWPTWNPEIPKNVGIVWTEFGSQMLTARPMRASMRPIVTTNCATSGAVARRRMSNRSTTAPNRGAKPSTVITSARRVGSPKSTFNDQYT